MLEYQDELEEIIRLIAKQPHGMTITAIAAASGIGRHRVAKYLDVLTLSGRMGMKQVGNAKVFFCIEQIPIASMLNLSSDFIIVVNDREEVVYISDNLLKDQHLGRREVIGTEISEIGFSLLPIPNLSYHIKQALEGTEIVKDYSVATDGKNRWFRIKLISAALEGGAEGAGIVLREITQLKACQAQLKEQTYMDGIRIPATTDRNKEQKKTDETKTALKICIRYYQTLVNHTREGIIVPEPEGGIITFANPAIATMLGYTTHELQCRSVFTLTNDAGVQILREAQSRFTKDEMIEEELQLFHRNGTAVHTEITSLPIHPHGDARPHWLLLLTDVTRRKEKENAIMFTNTTLNSIIEGSDRMIAAFDLNFAFIASNPAYRDEFEHIFGTFPETGKRLEEVLSDLPDDLVKGKRLWARALQGEVFYTIQRLGKENDYEIRSFPLRNSDGEIFGGANLIHNITNLEKAVITPQLQEMQIHELMAAASHVIFTTDTGGRCTHISPILLQILGYTSEELVGEQILRIIDPADHACVQEYLDAAVQGSSDPATYRVVSRSGQHHTIRTGAHTRNNEDNKVEIQNIIHDIRLTLPGGTDPEPLFLSHSQ